MIMRVRMRLCNMQTHQNDPISANKRHTPPRKVKSKTSCNIYTECRTTIAKKDNCCKSRESTDSALCIIPQAHYNAIEYFTVFHLKLQPDECFDTQHGSYVIQRYACQENNSI